METEWEIERALHKGEFEIYLQPQVEIKTGQIVGAEALIRWRDPKRGWILPEEFIPWCEKRGEIQKIDRFMVHSICQYVTRRYDDEQSMPIIAVNISRQSLYEEAFIKWCKKEVEDYKVPCHAIELEITESGYLPDVSCLVEHIVELKKIGFKISMDDFGEGYSSLKMLQMLPVDSIKLDRGFFETIPHVLKSKKLITGIMNMARDLHLDVTAEGIENCSQLQFLEQLGCDKVQGYLFSRPLSIKQYEDYEKHYQNQYFTRGNRA